MGNIMGTVRWADPKRTIAVWTFADGDSPEAILEVTRAFTDLILSVPHPTSAIIDFLNYRTIPREILGMFPMMARSLPQADRRPKTICIVSNRGIINTMVDLFAKVYPGYQDRFVTFQTVQDALDYLRGRKSA